MRILIICQWYPPEPWRIFSELAEGLKANHHDVVVITGFPNYPSGKVYPGYKIKLFQWERINGVNVLRVPLYPNHGQSSIKRIINLISFPLFTIILAPFLVKRPDIIHAIQPPTTGLAGWLLSRLWRIPFTYEVQDMWPETLEATGMIHNPLLINIVSKYCNWLYRKSIAIRVISDGFKENMMKKGVPSEKIKVIYNWVDSEFYKPIFVAKESINGIKLAGKFVIIYAGNIGFAQKLETIIHAAEIVENVEEIVFLMIGDGVDLERLKGVVKSKGISNIYFLGRYHPEKMNDLYSIADLLLLHLGKDPLFEMTIPHKILSYMSTGKPIVAAIEGDGANLITSCQAGLCCSPENPETLAESIKAIYIMSPEKRLELGQNGRMMACTQFDMHIKIDEMEKLFQSIVNVRRQSKGF